MGFVGGLFVNCIVNASISNDELFFGLLLFVFCFFCFVFGLIFLFCFVVA